MQIFITHLAIFLISFFLPYPDGISALYYSLDSRDYNNLICFFISWTDSAQKLFKIHEWSCLYKGLECSWSGKKKKREVFNIPVWPWDTDEKHTHHYFMMQCNNFLLQDCPHQLRCAQLTASKPFPSSLLSRRLLLSHIYSLLGLCRVISFQQLSHFFNSCCVCLGLWFLQPGHIALGQSFSFLIAEDSETGQNFPFCLLLVLRGWRNIIPLSAYKWATQAILPTYGTYYIGAWSTVQSLAKGGLGLG